MIEHRAEFQTEPTLRRQEGIASDLWVHLAIAQDEMRQHGEHGFTRRALYPPDGDPTHTETDIMRVTCETPAPATGRLMCELKAEGEEESAHANSTKALPLPSSCK